jgi:hypothetical protein
MVESHLVLQEELVWYLWTGYNLLGVLHLSGELGGIDVDLQGLYLLALDTRGNFGVIWI